MGELLYEIKAPKTLMEMTWCETEELLSQTDVAMISVGAIEQHGPHLPLGTDTIQSTETLKTAARLLEQEGFKVLVGPTIPFGINPGAMGYPGSITLKTDTLKNLLVDVCESLYVHGFKKIVLFLGHDENYGTMMVAAQDLVDRYDDIKVIVLNPMPALKATETAALDLTKKPDGHAGAGETSRALCLYPNLVYLDRVQQVDVVQQDDDGKILGGEPPLLGGGVYNPAEEGRSFSKAKGDPGQIGDPLLATAEAGLKAYEAMGEVIAKVIKKHFFNK